MRKLLLWLKCWYFRALYVINGLKIKPCPDCGRFPVISVHHDTISIQCKQGCHCVSSDSASWAELVWRWNDIVDAYHKHRPQQQETLGFGQYLIEHPVAQDTSHLGHVKMTCTHSTYTDCPGYNDGKSTEATGRSH